MTIQGIFSLDGRDGSVNEISEGLSIGALGCCDAVCGHALSRVHQGSIFCSFSLLLILLGSLYLLHHAPYFLVLFFLALIFSGVIIFSPGLRREAAAAGQTETVVKLETAASSSAPLLSLWPLVTPPVIGWIN